LADSLEQDELEELIDEMTIGQLAGILCEIDSHGRERIEPKEKARERGVPSPDRAEALMLALCKPPQTYEFRSTRDLGKQEAGLEDDDPDDYGPRGRWEAIAPRRLRWPRGGGAW
jgi:hypothetical protein